MRDSVARRVAPQRRFVERFDSLIIKAKDMRTAANELRAFVGENPGAKPFAELVWEGYGRLSIAKDPVASIEIREMQAAAYPTSVAAENSVGRAYLFRGDTTTALKHFVRARDLVADNLVTEDQVAKLTAARESKRSTQFDVSFDTVTVAVQGRPQRLSLRVSVEQTATTSKARIYVNSDTGLVATEVVSANKRSWVFAPAFGQTLELRWVANGANVVGTWALGWANNGALKGIQAPK